MVYPFWSYTVSNTDNTVAACDIMTRKNVEPFLERRPVRLCKFEHTLPPPAVRNSTALNTFKHLFITLYKLYEETELPGRIF